MKLKNRLQSCLACMILKKSGACSARDQFGKGERAFPLWYNQPRRAAKEITRYGSINMDRVNKATLFSSIAQLIEVVVRTVREAFCTVWVVAL